MKYLVLAVLFGTAFYIFLEKISDQAHLAQAIRCAEYPDILGCESFQTSSGSSAKTEP